MVGDPWPWGVLDLTASATPREVRRAYAQRLKALEPEDVHGFQALRQAYEAAVSMAQAAENAAESADRSGAEASSPAPDLVTGPGVPGPEDADSATQSGRPPERSQPAPPQPAPPQPDPPWQGGAARGAEASGSSLVQADRAPPDLALHQARAALYDRVGALLARDAFGLWDWEPIFGSPLLEDRSFAAEIEGLILRRMQALTAPPPAGWIKLADGCFGWRRDGVGLLRRHPSAQRALGFILASAQSEAKPPQAPRGSGGLIWGLLLALAFLGKLLTSLIETEYDTAIPGQVLFGLFAGLMIMALFLILWAFGLRGVLWWIAGLVPPLAERRYALRRWFMGSLDRRGRFGRWQGFLLAMLVTVWLVILGFFTTFDSHPRPRVSSIDLRAAVSAQRGNFGIFRDTLLFRTSDGAQADLPQLHFPASAAQPGPMSLSCPGVPGAPRQCLLVFVARASLARVAEVGPGHPTSGLYIDLMRDPMVVVTIAAPDKAPEVMVFQQVLGQFDLPLGTAPSGPAIASPMALFPLILPGMQPGSSGVPIPWPDHFEPRNIGDCLAAKGPIATARPCEVSPEMISRQAQADCGDTPPLACLQALVTRLRQGQGQARTPLTLTLAGPGVDLMQDLGRRMMTPGLHPPLPASPEVEAMRDQVLADYALILDQPEAVAQRLDKAAITAALGRQPQLYDAYGAGESTRHQVWQGLLGQMARLGFDMTEVRRD